MIENVVIKNCKLYKKSKTNKLMHGRLDFKKSYDMLSHSWILETFDMCEIAENVCAMIKNNIPSRKAPVLFIIVLISLSTVLCKVTLRKNGDCLSHLLFMEDLKLFAETKPGIEKVVETVRMCSMGIGIELGFSKCAVLNLKRGEKQVIGA